MSILVIAEHDNRLLAAATMNTLSAALEVAGQTAAQVDILVAGHNCRKVAEQAARVAGIRRVLLADSEVLENHLAENLAAQIVALADAYSHIVTPSTTFGRNFMPRVAALLNVAQVSDISAVIAGDTFERPVYAGNALHQLQSLDSKILLTVRTTCFEAVESSESAVEIESVEAVADSGLSRFVRRDLSESDRPELTSARVVIAGGRGMRDSASFDLLYAVADKLGAAVGASRAAVDAGFVSNDFQVGQTGKVVAPELYIAVGISGAIQHLAGMKDSKVIVAINSDPEAPVFQVADYGLVGDLFEVLPELESLL